MGKFRIDCNVYLATLLELAIVLLVFWFMRFVFYWVNSSMFGDISFSHLLRLAQAGIRFDVCAVAWFNIPFIFMRFLPFKFTANRIYILITNIIFVISNSLLLILNLIDIPLYSIFGFRTSMALMNIFFSEPNIGMIIFGFTKNYWWVFLFVFIIILFLILLVTCLKIRQPVKPDGWSPRQFFLMKTGIFFCTAFITFVGSWGRSITTNPLYVEYAMLHTDKISEINIVLNTPFTLLKMDDDFRLSRFEFFTEEELTQIRNSIKIPPAETVPNYKNLVIITIESGGTLWFEDLNVSNPTPHDNLSPFLNSLIPESLVFKNTFATSIVTVDGVRNIFAGFPAYGFFLISDAAFTQTSIEGIASLLNRIGYSSKFYYGGEKDSFHFYPFFVKSGFDNVTYLDILPPSKEKKDKYWGYWDHDLLNFMANDLDSLPQPFFAGAITLNPHDPFSTPKFWREDEYRFPPDSEERAVEYIDKSLETFFTRAKEKDWYTNTIFIITADHGSRFEATNKWQTTYIQPHILFMIFDPSRSLPTGISDITVGQIDIMPTALFLLGYPYPYLAFGESVFSPNRPHYAFNVIGGKYQVTGDRYLVRFDDRMTRIEEVFDITKDVELQNPLTTFDSEEIENMQRWGQALLQDYSQRIYENRMTVETSASKNK